MEHVLRGVEVVIEVVVAVNLLLQLWWELLPWNGLVYGGPGSLRFILLTTPEHHGGIWECEKKKEFCELWKETIAP